MERSSYDYQNYCGVCTVPSHWCICVEQVRQVCWSSPGNSATAGMSSNNTCDILAPLHAVWLVPQESPQRGHWTSNRPSSRAWPIYPLLLHYLIPSSSHLIPSSHNKPSTPSPPPPDPSDPSDPSSTQTMSAATGLADFKEREFIAVIGDEVNSSLPPPPAFAAF